MAGKIKVFLDSSVLIAGLHSAKGGSGYILELMRKDKIVGLVSPLVIEEVKRNIEKKLDSKLLVRLEKLIRILKVQEIYKSKDLLKYLNLINIKDVHILVAFASSKADFLITLDVRHFKTEKLQRANLSFKIATPKEFLEREY